jgi:phage terminase Nu1 subunit (DNA packaging protein)
VAKFTGLSDRTIRDWQAREIIPRGEDLGEIVRGIIAYYRSAEQTKKRESEPAKTNLYLERTRLTKAQADTVELELAEKDGTLVDATEVVKVWSDYILAARAKLLGIPTKLAYELASIANPLEIEGILREVIDEALLELAREDFAIGATTVSEDGECVSPTTEADSLGVG